MDKIILIVAVALAAIATTIAFAHEANADVLLYATVKPYGYSDAPSVAMAMGDLNAGANTFCADQLQDQFNFVSQSNSVSSGSMIHSDIYCGMTNGQVAHWVIAYNPSTGSLYLAAQ